VRRETNPVVFGKGFGMYSFPGTTLRSVLTFALAEARLTETLKQMFLWLICLIWHEPQYSGLTEAGGHLKQDELAAVSVRVRPRSRLICGVSAGAIPWDVRLERGLLIPHSSPGAEARHQHGCWMQGLLPCRGAQVPLRQGGLKKLPEAFCQLEADVKCDSLILGQEREFPGLLSPCIIYFQDHWKLPWPLEACV